MEVRPSDLGEENPIKVVDDDAVDRHESLGCNFEVRAQEV